MPGPKLSFIRRFHVYMYIIIYNYVDWKKIYMCVYVCTEYTPAVNSIAHAICAKLLIWDKIES